MIVHMHAWADGRREYICRSNHACHTVGGWRPCETCKCKSMETQDVRQDDTTTISLLALLSLYFTPLVLAAPPLLLVSLYTYTVPQSERPKVHKSWSVAGFGYTVHIHHTPGALLLLVGLTLHRLHYLARQGAVRAVHKIQAPKSDWSSWGMHACCGRCCVARNSMYLL